MQAVQHMNPRWSVPPPRFGFPPPNPGMQNMRPSYPIHQFQPRLPPPMMQQQQQQPQQQQQQNNSGPTQAELDARRPVRKSTARKTVDYNSAILKYLEARVWQRPKVDRRSVQSDAIYYAEMTPPQNMLDNPTNAVTTKFVRTSTNKMRCPIFCCLWTPEGRRLITGASSGEFTLWNGLTFNFETILQAHAGAVRSMVWSHNDLWMVTGDHIGFVKYWQSNMNNVKMIQAHKETVRGISFCPTDTKLVTCSDDGTACIMDFYSCQQEHILRGHGGDVKTVDWHPQKGLIVSGSKDSQKPIILWDARCAQDLATIHVHKNTVMCTKFNQNGNWLLTGSRDHLLKLFDIRNFSQELQTFRGHKKEVCSVAWHPQHESLFSSGGSDGSIMFWDVGTDKEVGCMEQAHDGIVWSLSWHPLGHILCSGSNDHTSKFWTRNRPGDKMRDKYNLNTMPKGSEEAVETDEQVTTVHNTSTAIPGMGLEKSLLEQLKPDGLQDDVIPGLDFNTDDAMPMKKVPFAKPIPKSFQQNWMDMKRPASASSQHEARDMQRKDTHIKQGIASSNSSSWNQSASGKKLDRDDRRSNSVSSPWAQSAKDKDDRVFSGAGNYGDRDHRQPGMQASGDKDERQSNRHNESNEMKDFDERSHNRNPYSQVKYNRGGMQDSQVKYNREGVQDSQVKYNRDGAQDSQVRYNRDNVQDSQVKYNRDGAQDSQVKYNRDGAQDSQVKYNREGLQDSSAVRYNREGMYNNRSGVQDGQRKRQWNTGPGAPDDKYNSNMQENNHRSRGRGRGWSGGGRRARGRR